MRAKLSLCVALALVSASATATFAQQLQYDRTGDHLASYGPVLPSAQPRATQKQFAVPAVHGAPVIDRTADHMLYYGPVQ